MRYYGPNIVSWVIVGLFAISIVWAKTPTRLGFYNVQNLFDTINDPSVNDTEFSDPTTNQYHRKLRELSAAIALFKPDILGLCEVENYGVVRDLVKETHRPYNIVHFDSRDSRGIDVALLFDRNKFRLISSELFKVKFVARDFLRAELSTVKDDHHFVVYVVHLPSKRGGKGAATRRERALTVLDSLSTVETLPMIVCGDMNDNPKQRPLLYNSALNPYLNGMGSYAYRDVWGMLDQIFISEGIRRTLKSDQIVVADSSLTTQSGRYEGYPRRNRPSDHFPTYIDFEL